MIGSCTVYLIFVLKFNEFGKFRGDENKMIWNANKNEVFSMRTFYNALEEGCEVVFPSKTIWGSWAPIEVCFLAWEATWFEF